VSKFLLNEGNTLEKRYLFLESRATSSIDSHSDVDEFKKYKEGMQKKKRKKWKKRKKKEVMMRVNNIKM